MLKKKIASLSGRIAFQVLSRLSKRLTVERIDRWGARLGCFIRLASVRYRGVVRRNLSKSFPDWSAEKVDRVGRDVFRNFARGILEFFHLLNLTREDVDRWVEIEGIEHIDQALEKKRGAIIITAHFGNWELCARKLALSGYRLNVIARDSDDPGMTGITNKIRQDAGYRVLSRDNAALPALRCLRKNELLGILPDQNSWTGAMVDFFGRPAMTATGPAVLSLKSGAPVLCGFAHRQPDGRFKARVHPPLDVPLTGDEEEDAKAITAALTKAIEDEIRSDPSQWLWLHDRWRRAEEIAAGKVAGNREQGTGNSGMSS